MVKVNLRDGTRDPRPIGYPPTFSSPKRKLRSDRAYLVVHACHYPVGHGEIVGRTGDRTLAFETRTKRVCAKNFVLGLVILPPESPHPYPHTTYKHTNTKTHTQTLPNKKLTHIHLGSKFFQALVSGHIRRKRPREFWCMCAR